MDRELDANRMQGEDGRSRVLLGVAAGLSCVVLFIGCALPGKHYVAVPVIWGSLEGAAIPDSETRLRRVVIHRENPALNAKSEVALEPSGEFSFDAVEFRLAGREYSKSYRVFLHLQDATRSRVIWRATLSRRELAGAIELDCDMDRPAQQGQPCWVRNPTRHPWHVAEGKRTFTRLCASCHGVGGAGGKRARKSTGTVPPDLSEIALRRGGRFDRAEVAEWIEGRSLPASHGTRTMPVWGESLSETYERYAEGDELIGAELDPVLAYLESLQKSVEPDRGGSP